MGNGHDRTKYPNCENCIDNLRDDKKRLKEELEKVKHERDCYRMVCVGLEIQLIDELSNGGADVAYALGCHMANVFKKAADNMDRMAGELEALDTICKLQEKMLNKLGVNSELQSK